MASWEDTGIWEELKSRRDDSSHSQLTCSAVCMSMPAIERVLKSASTSPTDFTLHDEEHAFRVAEWMRRLIPLTTWNALSHYELALLLFAAYLHDIGMSPEQQIVRRLHDHLLTGDRSLLGDEERRELYTWLDSNAYPAVDASPDALHSSGNLVRESVSLYCRHRHNDWTEKWIRERMPALVAEPIYPSWQVDLIALCRSHHEGFEALTSTRFDPFVVQGVGDVHLRYLACVLRLADILDVDPERTPRAILRHRDIANGSLIYWHKDHEISIELHQHTICLSARPSRAFIHRAITDSAEMIEEELRLCHRVSVEKPFDHNYEVPSRRLPHLWRIMPFLQRRITPREDAYEYIDGAFRPSPDKILRLLGSQELYLTPQSAIRELLQNAFDAIRERIAYERLSSGVDSAELGNRHKVRLSLEMKDSEHFLVCKDDGAGMSKAIICDHFLVSGTAERPDLRRLSRRCEAQGFSLERTAQFGIGVLSYFLLADSVTVNTRRLVEAGDESDEGWQFHTDGIGTFGELRRCLRNEVGTTVALHLRPGLFDEASHWWQDLVDYVRETVVRSPCCLEVSSDLDECHDRVSCHAGWLRTEHDLSRRALSWLEAEIEDASKFIGSPGDTLRVEASRLELVESLRHTKQDAEARLKWHTSEETAIEGVGLCRIHVPYFELEGGTSPLYMKTSHLDDKIRITPLRYRPIVEKEVNTATGTESLITLSWKGMSVRPKTVDECGSRHVFFTLTAGPHHHTIVEMDCSSPTFGRLSLSRESIDLGENVEEWTLYRLVAAQVADARVKLAEMQRESPFSILHYVLAHRPAPPNSIRSWIRSVAEPDTSEHECYWDPAVLPATRETKVVPHTGLTLNTKPVEEFSDFSFWCGGSGWARFWPFPPTRVVVLVCSTGGRYLLPIWDRFEEPKSKRFDATICEFPDAWDDVVGAMAPNLGQVWNSLLPQNPVGFSLTYV